MSVTYSPHINTAVKGVSLCDIADTMLNILTGCISVWYGSCTAKDRKVLRSVVRSAEFIIGRELPALQDIFHTRCIRKAGRILKDCYHPSFRLFSPLPSGRRYRSIRSRTRRLESSFFPRAIRFLNGQWYSLATLHFTCYSFVLFALSVILYYLKPGTFDLSLG